MARIEVALVSSFWTANFVSLWPCSLSNRSTNPSGRTSGMLISPPGLHIWISRSGLSVSNLRRPSKYFLRENEPDAGKVMVREVRKWRPSFDFARVASSCTSCVMLYVTSSGAVCRTRTYKLETLRYKVRHARRGFYYVTQASEGNSSGSNQVQVSETMQGRREPLESIVVNVSRLGRRTNVSEVEEVLAKSLT